MIERFANLARDAVSAALTRVRRRKTDPRDRALITIARSRRERREYLARLQRIREQHAKPDRIPQPCRFCGRVEGGADCCQ